VNPEILKKRLIDIVDNIDQDQKLLKDFKDALRYEDDPLRQAKYRRSISRIKESLAQHEQEYDEVRQQVLVKEQSAEFELQLQQIDEKLNLILGGQVATYQNLIQMRQVLLSRYSQTERHLVEAVAEQLSQGQLLITQTLLNAIEENKVSEPEMKQVLLLLEERVQALPSSHSSIANLIKDPGLDVKHKLKVAIPLIPFVLDYEGEIELGTGLNLETVWKGVLAKLGVDREF
jgi:hypothetical protein